MPARLSCELPATPGWPDQYAIAGDNHHGARNGRSSADISSCASPRSSTASCRSCKRLAISTSLGQSFSSQSRKIGKIDNVTAIQTAGRDLIDSSKLGSAMTKIDKKK